MHCVHLCTKSYTTTDLTFHKATGLWALFGIILHLMIQKLSDILVFFLHQQSIILSYLRNWWGQFCKPVLVTNILRNCTYWNVLKVNTNFSGNQTCPVICKWKLVKHLDCFGDNKKTKDSRKIKLCSLKMCCVTLFSYSFSQNGMISLRQSLKNPDTQNKQGAQKGKHLRNQRQYFYLQQNLPKEG